MRPKRINSLFILLGLVALVGVVLAGLACSSSAGGYTDVAPYRQEELPPFWICASVTPTPTDVVASWCDAATPPATPLCDDPETPTPYPTPTDFVAFSDFKRHQNIWIPGRSAGAPRPDATPRAWTDPEMMRVNLVEFSRLGDYDGQTCLAFQFAVKSFYDDVVDFDLYTQVFYRSSGDLAVYHTTQDVLDHFFMTPAGGLEVNVRYEPGEEKSVYVPICHPPSLGDGDLQVGLLTGLYGSRSGAPALEGSGGGNTPTGADTAIYIDPFNLSPRPCSYPPSKGYYPEVDNYPGFQRGWPSLTIPLGGRFSGEGPVAVPPCLYITRGFGCSEFPTGVAGAGLCPAEAPWFHTGIDFSCYEGTPVYDVLGGTLWQGDGGAYGHLAVVERAPYKSMYAHLSAFESGPLCNLQSGCQSGQVVGYVGATGFSTGPHLHWEWRVNEVPQDPQLWAGSARALDPSLLASISLLSARPTATPAVYPLTLILRAPAGRRLSGPSVGVSDIDGARVAEGVFVDGECRFSLTPGVYRLALSGALADGTPVDAYGQANVQAMQSGQAEYLHGPLAVWHDRPSTTAGLVLTRDGNGVGQPVFDHAPAGRPQPLDPAATTAWLAPKTPSARPATGPVARGRWDWLGLVCCVAALGLLGAVVWLVGRRGGRRDV